MLVFLHIALWLLIKLKTLVRYMGRKLNVVPSSAVHFDKYMIIQYLDGNTVETLVVPKDPDQVDTSFIIRTKDVSSKYSQPIGVPILVTAKHFDALDLVSGFDE